MVRFLRDQRVRFLAVGATNTLVGYLIFSAFTLWVFADVHLGYLLSLALSYAVGISLAFVLYRRFVFVVHGHVLRDFARFVSVYLVAIGINAVALPLLVEVVRVPPLLAQLIILVVTTLLSFFGHKKFSFRRSGAE
ncbi:GtrA family protein [Cryobacterium sp. Hb1]|nr:GtrA family protein [Cryobacterium sp. Hb1]